ncbi:sensor histidine kinase [Parvularcula oceani]|uniref:sensor histidine kinase n=1 Tax=Parvularcula oceani TaxID=1247963 RepID=UPI0004E113E6|nr:sensor histidine kinase [Parvularcula oceani]
MQPVRVWVRAPAGRDSILLHDALAGLEDEVRIAEDTESLRSAFHEPEQIGVLLLTQEALTADVISILGDSLEDQPPWSELPLILLVDAYGNTADALSKLQSVLPRAKPLVLQRPIRVSELESAVEAMRRSRLRQYALRDYIAKQSELRRELNHRVKNILATVQALFGLTARKAESLESFAETFQGRLSAMAAVHAVLYESDYGASSLEEILEGVLTPYRQAISFEPAPASLHLPAEIAQSIALIMHELATNASKHGALQAEEGRVTLSWKDSDAQSLRLCWQERNGPPVTQPERAGYGVSFIDATMRSYGGEAEFDYAAEGLSVSLTAPMPRQDIR